MFLVKVQLFEFVLIRIELFKRLIIESLYFNSIV